MDRKMEKNMGELAEFRAWEELIPDVLGLIFRNLSLRQILLVVPRVCKSWSRAVSGPYCWQEIDLTEWSSYYDRRSPEQYELMLHLLFRRSSGNCRRLAVSGIPNDSIFSIIADYAGSLQSLEIPRSEISDAVVEKVAERFCNITFLDISCCRNIGPRALKSFGIHCKSLLSLRRTMQPLEFTGKVCQDDEALAIALTMPKLRHLELAFLLLTTKGVLQILSHCQELRFLDIRGCGDVKLDEKLVKEKYAELRILGPCLGRNFWYESLDYSDISEYSYGVCEDMSDEENVLELAGCIRMEVDSMNAPFQRRILQRKIEHFCCTDSRMFSWDC